jgi:hypothetical protein
MRFTQIIAGAAAFGPALASLERYNANTCSNKGCPKYECENHCPDNFFGKYEKAVEKFKEHNHECYKCCCDEYKPTTTTKCPKPTEHPKCELGANGLKNAGFENGIDASPWKYDTGRGQVIKENQATGLQPKYAQDGKYYFDIIVSPGTLTSPQTFPVSSLSQHAEVCSKGKKYEIKFYYQYPTSDKNSLCVVKVYIDDQLVGTLPQTKTTDWTMATFDYPAARSAPKSHKRDGGRYEDEHEWGHGPVVFPIEKKYVNLRVEAQGSTPSLTGATCTDVYVDTFSLKYKTLSHHEDHEDHEAPSPPSPAN